MFSWHKTPEQTIAAAIAKTDATSEHTDKSNDNAFVAAIQNTVKTLRDAEIAKENEKRTNDKHKLEAMHMEWAASTDGRACKSLIALQLLDAAKSQQRSISFLPIDDMSPCFHGTERGISLFWPKVDVFRSSTDSISVLF
jgi:hypothetical protein